MTRLTIVTMRLIMIVLPVSFKIGGTRKEMPVMFQCDTACRITLKAGDEHDNQGQQSEQEQHNHGRPCKDLSFVKFHSM